MIELLSQPWPWYVAGPLIGLVVPLLLILTGKDFGISSSLRHTCAAVLPTKADYFRYDWKASGAWNMVFALGILGGGVLAALIGGIDSVAISEATRADLAAMGITDFSGLAPADLFSWSNLTLPGIGLLFGGGILLGFGARYAGGCTSGHAIMGLATFQKPSLIAVVGFFIGGLLMALVLMPLMI